MTRSSKALWAAVGLAAVALVVAAFVPALTQDDGDDRREAVARYIQDVNRIQTWLGEELETVNRTYEQLQVGPDAAGQTEELERAEKTIAELQARVSELRPPPEAELLHAELEKLLTLQAGFALEVTELGRFLPLLAQQERELDSATAWLRRELNEAETTEAYAAAFDRYGASLGEVEDALSRLSATPALAGALEAERARVLRLGDLAERVRRAIGDERAADVDRLFRDLADELNAAGPVEAKREAVAEYERSLQEIARQREAVEGERVRLNRELES